MSQGLLQDLPNVEKRQHFSLSCLLTLLLLLMNGAIYYLISSELMQIDHLQHVGGDAWTTLYYTG